MLTANRQPPAHAFKPGNQMGKGRGVGSRNALATSFFKDTYALWEEQGEAALRRAAFEQPMQFVAMIAKLMPAKLEISTPTDGMTDEQLLRMIELAERMAAIGASNAKASMTIERGGVEAQRGGGSPHATLKGGEVIEGVLLAGPSSEPSSADDLVETEAVSAAAAPIGDPPSSTVAIVPVRLDPVQPETQPADAMDDEVDPLSLF